MGDSVIPNAHENKSVVCCGATGVGSTRLGITAFTVGFVNLFLFLPMEVLGHGGDLNWMGRPSDERRTLDAYEVKVKQVLPTLVDSLCSLSISKISLVSTLRGIHIEIRLDAGYATVSFSQEEHWKNFVVYTR